MSRYLILWIGLWVGLLIGLFAAPSKAQVAPPSRFEGWASVIVAADWRDSRGQPIPAFDNAQRDLTAAFQAAGLPADGMVSASLNPAAEPATSATDLVRRIQQATATHTRGCFLYFTSHGSRTAMVFGNQQLAPADLAPMVNRWCGDRPTFIVISACFSGIFVEGLEGPNRVILTAASRDRSSFGCGAGEQYPWFDACVLENLPAAQHILALASATRACVEQREQANDVGLPSQPQLYVGSMMQLRAPTLRFQTASDAGS